MNTEITCRVWELVTKTHDSDGNVIITEDAIKRILNANENVVKGKGSIKRYAYILHNQDVYTQESILKDKPELAGQHKDDHFHVVMEFTRSQSLSTISSWFQIPENFFEKKRGRQAFLDSVRYLTHESDREQERGKHLYPDEAVKANFDWRPEVDEMIQKRAERKARYGKAELTELDELILDVSQNGMTLKKAQEKNPLLYVRNATLLKTARLTYLSSQKPPSCRMNIYIDGPGRIGKDLTSIGIARSWFPDLSDDECFFKVGAKNVSFEGYDGQPVIIWSDRRASSFLHEFGRENLFDGILNTFPQGNIRQNVKYSSTCLVNVVNIVNGIQPFKAFLDGLAGEYIDKFGNKIIAEDKNQSYGRFPMIIPIRAEDFDILLNKGYVDDSKNFQEYYTYRNVQGNMKKIQELCNNRENIALQLQKKLLSPVTNAGKQLLSDKMSKGQEYTDEELLQMFDSYGTGYSQEELSLFFQWYKMSLNKWINALNPAQGLIDKVSFKDVNEWLKNGKPDTFNYGLENPRLYDYSKQDVISRTGMFDKLLDIVRFIQRKENISFDDAVKRFYEYKEKREKNGNGQEPKIPF